MPLEQNYGPGTVCSHWSEACLQTELMTGFVESTPTPLSRITIGTLQDLGYTVDYSKADYFGRSNLGTSTGCICNRRRSLPDMHHGETRQLGLGLPNTVRRVISNDAHRLAVDYGKSILAERALPPNVPRDDGAITYVGDQVVSVVVADGSNVFSVVVTPST